MKPYALIALLLGGLVCRATDVQTYDAVRDFSILSNPNNAWSYGYKNSLGGPFQLHNNPEVNVGYAVGSTGIDRWCTVGLDPGVLCVSRNTTGTTIQGTTFSYPASMLHMHPTIPSVSDVVRWTVPRTGNYSMSGIFVGLDVYTGVADVDVHVLLNSTTELVSPTLLRGVGTQFPFSYSGHLQAGDTIDFIVGPGPSGYHQNDSTGFQVSIEGPPTDDAPPVVSALSVTPSPLAVNATAGVSAIIDDTLTGGSAISSANLSVSGVGSFGMSLSPSSSPLVQASAALPSLSQSDVYTVCVVGVDSAGNQSVPACTLLPVYDPSGGFVTGGGQVRSPAGADLLNAGAAGFATFGFVSKYLPGKNEPSGNLEFQFKQGNLNFKSTSMDWLVVSGQPRAIFRGSGTVNGGNFCKFEVEAWDQSFPSDGNDAFGLKIFSCADGRDRYLLAPTPLVNGSIIIHQ